MTEENSNDSAKGEELDEEDNCWDMEMIEIVMILMMMNPMMIIRMMKKLWKWWRYGQDVYYENLDWEGDEDVISIAP